ncbi:MAG: NTP transferase domain-containing protein, partial [Blastocatellia bacterium]
MKAIILAAGLGRRMRPLTDRTHKALLPIAGTTILNRLLGSLRDCDVRDICLVTGYRSEELIRVVRDNFRDLNVEFVHNPQYEATNNVFSMALALESISIDDDILLIESDLILDPRVMRQIVHTRHGNAALVDRYHPGLDGTVVSIDNNDAITHVHPSYLQDESFDFSNKYKTLNIYRFDKDFTQSTFRELLSFYSRSIDANCYYELLLGVLIYMRATTVYAEYVQHPWAEVDDPTDLMFAEFQFNSATRRSTLE